MLYTITVAEDFGFRHLLWVYSGRRGVHCWVCDQEAIELSQEARTAIVEYLTLVRGGEQQAQKVHLKSPLHPSIRYALFVCVSLLFTVCFLHIYIHGLVMP